MAISTQAFTTCGLLYTNSAVSKCSVCLYSLWRCFGRNTLGRALGIFASGSPLHTHRHHLDRWIPRQVPVKYLHYLAERQLPSSPAVCPPAPPGQQRARPSPSAINAPDRDVIALVGPRTSKVSVKLSPGAPGSALPSAIPSTSAEKPHSRRKLTAPAASHLSDVAPLVLGASNVA